MEKMNSYCKIIILLATVFISLQSNGSFANITSVSSVASVSDSPTDKPMTLPELQNILQMVTLYKTRTALGLKDNKKLMKRLETSATTGSERERIIATIILAIVNG